MFGVMKEVSSIIELVVEYVNISALVNMIHGIDS